MAALRESGPVPGDENGKKRGDESAKKKKRPDKGVCHLHPIQHFFYIHAKHIMQIDMDKLAENLQRLQEDDLLQVVQMVHDHKTADSYTKNDVDGMTFPKPLFLLLLKQPPLTSDLSWRIPRRPLHPPRKPHPNAMGFLARTSRCCIVIAGLIRENLKGNSI